MEAEIKAAIAEAVEAARRAAEVAGARSLTITVQGDEIAIDLDVPVKEDRVDG